MYLLMLKYFIIILLLLHLSNIQKILLIQIQFHNYMIHVFVYTNLWSFFGNPPEPIKKRDIKKNKKKNQDSYLLTNLWFFPFFRRRHPRYLRPKKKRKERLLVTIHNNIKKKSKKIKPRFVLTNLGSTFPKPTQSLKKRKNSY